MGQCTCPMCDSTERRSILQNSSKIFIRFNNFKIFRWRISLMRQLNALPSCHILDPSLVISQATPSNGWPLSPLSLQPRHPALKLNKGLRETKTESQFRVPFWQTATSCVYDNEESNALCVHSLCQGIESIRIPLLTLLSSQRSNLWLSMLLNVLSDKYHAG